MAGIAMSLAGIAILAALVLSAGAPSLLASLTGLIASPTATPSPTATVAPTPTSTATSTATPTSTPQPPFPTDHLWLVPPIGPGGNAAVDRFYPYGSMGGGSLRIHHGVEFQNPPGTSVISAADGIVVVAGTDAEIVYGVRTNFYGNLVIVRLEQEYRGHEMFTLYAHLSSIAVSVGEQVSTGEPLGEVGMTGGAFGPHLHFEVRVGPNRYSNTRNPELWLQPTDGHGVLAGRVTDSAGTSIPEALITVHPLADPARRLAETMTYPSGEVRADDDWEENFAIGGLPSGEYLVRARVDGRVYASQIVVSSGQTTFVKLVAA
ncbi:MAG: peptidoglycan DD-metalloendopeptidase family protein [Anaerolineae bacterium]